nr:ATP-dependent helicase [Fodinibius salsisoli]
MPSQEGNKSPDRAAEPEVSFRGEEEETVSVDEAPVLNAEQQSVIEAIQGATLVKAGPGTGKTHTLIEWLVRQVEAGPNESSNIVAVTFTRKAAEEIRQRLRDRVGESAKNITIGTFHSLCWQWLQERFDHLSTIYDVASRRMTLRMLFPDMSASDRKELHEQIGTHDPTSFEKQLQTYRRHLWEQGAIDLSDLIYCTVEELKTDEQWLSELRQRCSVLAVDELQDINPIQYELVQLLGRNQNVLAIGDADQAIYGFRGSEVSLFFQFADDFEAQKITLKQNYRSTDRILKAAASLIQNNQLHSGAELAAQRQSDRPIKIFEAEHPFGEADYILEEINRYVGGVESLTTGTHTDSEYDYGFGDITILFRTNSVGEALFKALTKAGIPVHFGDGTPFLNEPSFTIVAHWLRFLQQPKDRIILSNLMEEAYGWSPAQISSLLQSLEENQTPILGEKQLKSIGESLQKDLDHLREFYHDLLELTEQGDLFKVVTAVFDQFLKDEQLSRSQLLKKETILELAGESNGNPEKFLEQMQLNPYTDAGRLKRQAVHLLTFHAAKGLEFPVVFIAAAEEGITPILREGADIAEERRLFYVAMTRAEEELQITHCRERFHYGEKEQPAPSRFIAELPQLLIEREIEEFTSGSDQSDTQNEQLGLF